MNDTLEGKKWQNFILFAVAKSINLGELEMKQILEEWLVILKYCRNSFNSCRKEKKIWKNIWVWVRSMGILLNILPFKVRYFFPKSRQNLQIHSTLFARAMCFCTRIVWSSDKVVTVCQYLQASSHSRVGHLQLYNLLSRDQDGPP